MSKHLTGSKRLQVIQNYLNGREDPEWNVLPTKKENKYIVKRRTEPLKIEQPIEHPIEEPKEQPIEEPKQIAPPPIPPPIPKPVYDPTINIEILNQLKLLGEEMKQKREKKEQKRMIKEVVHKQMNKPRYIYTQPQEPNEIEEEVNEPQIMPQPIYRRRNNIFSDIF